MTRETKVGLGIAAAVFIVVGGALAYKLYFLKPTTTEVADKPTASVSGPQVIPPRSEVSKATLPTNPVASASAQLEIRSSLEAAPPAPAPPTTANPSGSETVPPPPPMLVTEKPPVTLPDASTPQNKPGEYTKPAEPASVASSVSTPVEPPASPDASAPQSFPASQPAKPVVLVVEPPTPPRLEITQPTPDSKPMSGDMGSALEKSSPPTPPVVITPPASSGNESKPSTPGPVDNLPPHEPNSADQNKPASGDGRGSIDPRPSAGSTRPGGGALPSGTATPAINIPPPPPSDAFDRSYPAPPAPSSLVAGRDNRPRPEEAIPVTVRPQTQPLTPPPPDAYPVKIAPQPSSDGRIEVLDYEVQRYIVQPGESWESICRNKYGSERYARALAAFNRDRNPNLTGATPGRTILVPPADILHRRYPQWVQPTSNPISQGSSSVGGPASSWETAPTGVRTLATAPSANPAAAFKLYRVQPNDTMWLIAKRTLGSGDRWPEILRLNRDTLRDVNQLPPGLILRLPPDARVDETGWPR